MDEWLVKRWRKGFLIIPALFTKQGGSIDVLDSIDRVQRKHRKDSANSNGAVVSDVLD